MAVALWATAGFEPKEQADWWRVGCWHPTAARELADAGLSPHQLLDAEGKPRTIDALSGMPVATAVADGYITVERAAAMVEGTGTLRWTKR